MIKKIILTVTISFFVLLSTCVKINTLYDNYEQLEEKVLVLEGEIYNFCDDILWLFFSLKYVKLHSLLS